MDDLTAFDRRTLFGEQTPNLAPAAPPPSTPAAAPPPSGVPLDELRARWIDFLNISPTSVDTYDKATRLFIQWLHDNGIEKPRRDDILAYRRLLEADKKKPATIQLYITAIRQFFLWLEAENVYKNVALHVKGPKIERTHKRDYLTTGQVKAVLDKISRQTESGLRDYAILLLMVTCGLRRIEVCRADIEDIRAAGNCTRLYIQGKGKTEKADFVKIPPPVELAVREYITERNRRLRSPAIPLFTSVSNNSMGQRLSVRYVSWLVKNRFKAAGYDSDRLCAHSLRHTAVTLALLAGQPLQEVQMFARHTSIVTTMIYAHNIDKESNTCSQAIAGAIL